MNADCKEPQIDVRGKGDGHEFGMQVGSALHSKILQAQLSLAEFETFRLLQPWWMPLSVYQYMAQRRARMILEPSIARTFPHMADRIRGIAEGARTTVDFLYLFLAMESATASAQERQPAMAGCSAIAARGRRTPDQHAVIAHNFDLVDSAAPLLTLRESSGEQGLRFIGFALAPMAGVIDGVNEAGLAITYNYAPTMDVQADAPPVSFSVDQVLASCTTVTEAAQRLSNLPRGGGALLMLADATGDVASLELSASHAQLRRPESSEDLISHSNAYQTPAMQRHELPRSAVYASDAPKALRGTPVFQSAERRDQRIQELLGEHDILSSETLCRVMADHGHDDCGSADTVCMHGQYWSTLASIQLLPQERRMRVSYGPACSAQHHDFVL